jgi:hypothetical protein
MKNKIRGLRRRFKHIEEWRKLNIAPDFEENDTYDWCKLRIHPWNSLSSPKVPQGFKIEMLKALIQVHDSWKKRLDESGEDYYLAIWIFQNNFISSQVVMARGDELNFYDKTFFAPREKRAFDFQSYESIPELGRFTLSHMVACAAVEDDERENYPDDDTWNFYQRRLKAARLNNFGMVMQGGMEVFFVKYDDVWIARAASNT